MDGKNDNTLKNQIYNALFSDIINGVYSSDTVLTEKFLMEKYGVSRAPIREALTQLIGTHILSSIPRQGYKIIQPSKQQLLEIVKFRSVLESSFLENYYMYIDEAFIEELKNICMSHANCPDNDFMVRWNYNCEFHLKLFSIYGNQYAYKLLEDAMNIQTIFFIQRKHYSRTSLHRVLIDYLERKEIEMAVNILKADIENLMISDIAAIPTNKNKK